MRRHATLMQLSIAVVVLFIWQYAATVAGNPDNPNPLGILDRAQRYIASGVLLTAVQQSLVRVLQGFAISIIVGVSLGVLMGVWRPAEGMLSPVLETLRPIAPIAWIPMAVLWFGVTGNAAIFVVAYASFFPFVLNTVQAVQQIDRVLVRAGLVLGASRWRLIWSVVLPAALPTVLVGARISMGFAWASIVAAELAMGAKLYRGATLTVGIGQLMFQTLSFERDINALLLFIIVIGLISFAIDAGMRRLNRELMPWAA